MNLFDLSNSDQPSKGIVRTKQGGWAGAVDVGDVVNLNNETFRVVGPPRYKTKMLRGEVESGYVLIEPDGSREYYDMQGELHRDDGPAVIYSNGTETWVQHGRMHREDGPAVIYDDGAELWYRRGKLHKEDGPARTWADGTQEWWVDGKRHREDGPALVRPDGSTSWYYRGRRHREDGPAVVNADGTEEYWLHGEQVNKEDLP